MQKAMSALPLKADICSAPADVRYGRVADNGSLLSAMSQRFDETIVRFIDGDA